VTPMRWDKQTWHQLASVFKPFCEALAFWLQEKGSVHIFLSNLPSFLPPSQICTCPILCSCLTASRASHSLMTPLLDSITAPQRLFLLLEIPFIFIAPGEPFAFFNYCWNTSSDIFRSLA
jgi:hypothetical protein